MAESQSVRESIHSLTMQDDEKRVAPVEKLPVELLAHIFTFVDMVSQKRSELVCQLWKDVLRSPAVRSGVWIKEGAEWWKLLEWKNPEKVSIGDWNGSFDEYFWGHLNPSPMLESSREVEHDSLEKCVSDHTQKIIFTGRITPIAGDMVTRFDWLWEMLDKGNRDGKPGQKIILHDVRINLRSLVEASIWKSGNSWSLEGANIELVGISSTWSVSRANNGYFSPGFSVGIDKFKLHFRDGESPQEIEEKIWSVIADHSVVTNGEYADLEWNWGHKAKDESCSILRLREPLYRDGVLDLKDVEWKTLKPSTLREIASCIAEELWILYGLDFEGLDPV